MATKGKIFATDFSQATEVTPQTKVLVQTPDNPVEYAEIEQIAEYIEIEKQAVFVSGQGENSGVQKNAQNTAHGVNALAVGMGTEANGEGSHAEGVFTQSGNRGSHAEGVYTKANGEGSHAEGSQTEASGDAAHAEGTGTKAMGKFSHAEGSFSKSADYSHAEGNATQALGVSSHAEGNATQALGVSSHAEGARTQAIGRASHSGGIESIATAKAAFAHGEGIVAENDHEVAFGRFNKSGARTLFSVGNGASDNERSNAFEVEEDGTIYSPKMDEQSFFQAPRIEIERPAPMGPLTEENSALYAEKLSNPTIRISHPYFEAHPDECYFALVRYGRTKRKRSHTPRNSDFAVKNPNCWSFFTGALGYTTVGTLPIHIESVISYRELIKTIMNLGGVQLDKYDNPPRVAFIKDWTLTTFTADIYLNNEAAGFEYDETVTDSIENLGEAERIKAKTKYGIVLIKPNPNFVMKENAKNPNAYRWNTATGEYRWLVSDVCTFKLTYGLGGISGIGFGLKL